LFSGEDRELIEAGMAMMMQTSVNLMKKSQELQASRRIMGVDGAGGDENPNREVEDEGRSVTENEDADEA
jgi:hypothetical protein